MTDQVQGYTFQYAYSNEIIQAFVKIVQPVYEINFDSQTGDLYIGDLNPNNTGTSNLAIGSNALFSNTSGSNNVAIGNDALYYNTTSNNNTAIGTQALYYDTGEGNIGIGADALRFNTSGNYNSAIGTFALEYNETGNYNTAIGSLTLQSNTTGSNNIAIGYNSLINITSGSGNVVIGNMILSNSTTNVNNMIWIGNNQVNYPNIYPLNNGTYENNSLFIAPNVGLIGGIDNNTFDTTTNKIVPSTSSYVIIYGEIATSFGGTAPTSITAGASPYTFTPSSTTNQIVIISGGSVSSIALNGTTTGLTSGTFYCRAGDSLTITYSTAPTILQYNV